MKFEIKNRWTAEVQVTAEIECAEDDTFSLKLGLAVKWAVEHKANLRYANLRYANLRSADLSYANLRSANLRYAHLSYANLRSANLRYADLSYADLSYADLSYANLRSANLRYAKIDESTPIETGETWKEYKEQVVPALLIAGGKALQEVVEQSWDCHSWENCPMAVAFNVHRVENIPIIYRPRAEQFIKYFDAGMISKPEIIPSEKGQSA